MINQPTIKLTDRDFATIRNAYLKDGGYLDSRYANRAAEFKDNSSSMAVLELQMVTGEIFQFAVNKEMGESYLLTIREPDNMLLKAQSLSYSPRMPTAAVGYITFTPKPSAPSVAYLIRKGDMFTTGPAYGTQIRVEAQTSVVGAAGSSATIEVAEGITVIDPSRLSAGQVGQRLLLAQYPVIQDSITLVIAGVTWTKIDNFLNSGPSDTHYRVMNRETLPGTRRAYLEFGDNTNGLYPPSGSLITAQYRIGGGQAGNVPAGQITRSESTIYSLHGGVSIPGTITNSLSLSGGTDAEEMEDIRKNAVGPMRTNERLVSNEDYEDAIRMAGAARAKALTQNEWALLDENLVIVFASTTIGTEMTTTACDALKTSALLTRKHTGTGRFLVSPAKFDAKTASVNVVIAQGTNYTTLYNLAVAISNAFFSYASIFANPDPRFVIDVGKTVYPNQLDQLIQNLSGVISVITSINSSTDPYSPDNYKIPYITLTVSMSFEG